MRIKYSTRAERDFEEIGDYIAEDDPLRAVRFVQQLRQACEGLVEFPRRFPLADRYGDMGIRQRVFGNYLIFYLVACETVSILHIAHGSRES